jgi:hypothetical protein
LLLACCSHSGAAQVTKTEVLPADGCELGKAFVELTDAFKAADKGRAAKYLDPTAWHLDDKQPSWFAQLAEQLATYSSIGGRRHGDRATLFVETKQPYYAMMNASYTAGRWQFDSPIPVGSNLNPSGRDCEPSPTRFPCAAASAPDAQVSGTVQSHMIDPKTNTPARPAVLFDGLAVRMIDEETKSLKSKWIVLSGTGINPQMVALSEEPDQVKGWLSYPVLTLDVAPDGKSANIEYFDGYSRKNLDVSSGLSIDMSVPNRIHGHLKTDAKNVASFDISFDVSTVSDCIADKYQCGD